jgi:hypothetical protein
MQDDSNHPDNLPDLGRRRFTRGGAAATVVLGSLASQPVLGQNFKHCTPSGRWSGNMSYGGTLGECGNLGEDPNYWRDGGNWIVYNRGTLPTGTGQNICSGGSGDTFNAVFGGSYFFAARETGGGASRCVTRYATVQPAGGRAATLLEVLRMVPSGVNQETEELGREAVAALLNVEAFAGYPLTKLRVIDMFKAVHLPGGTYAPADPILAKDPWPRSWVLRYLRSLHTPVIW